MKAALTDLKHNLSPSQHFREDCRDETRNGSHFKRGTKVRLEKHLVEPLTKTTRSPWQHEDVDNSAVEQTYGDEDGYRRGISRILTDGCFLSDAVARVTDMEREIERGVEYRANTHTHMDTCEYAFLQESRS